MMLKSVMNVRTSHFTHLPRRGDPSGLVNAVSDAGKISAAFRIIKVHPDTHRSAHHVFFGHETPFPTVIAAVTVVAHHKIMTIGYNPLAIAAAGTRMQQDIVFNIINDFTEANGVRAWRGAFHLIAGVATVFAF